MGRNGTEPRGTADSVNASLRSFSSFSRSPFLLHPRSPSFSSSLLFHSTPFCVHHSALSIPRTIYRLYSNTFDTRFFPLPLFLPSPSFPLTVSPSYTPLSGSVSFHCFSLFLLVTVKRAGYANAAILCYACGPRV